MKHKKINKLSDTISVSDTKRKPVGIIRVYDSDGHLIKEVHNMVVFSGRKLLAALLADKIKAAGQSSASNISAIINNSNNFNFAINFSYTTSGDFATAEKTSYADVKNDNVVYSKSLKNSADCVFDVGADDIRLIITVTLSEDETFKKFNQVYLTYTDSNIDLSNNVALFSRASLSPVYLSASETYSIEYTLYF